MGGRAAARALRVTLLVALPAMVTAAGCTPAPELPTRWMSDDVAPESALIGCERAAERVEISVTSHLDPACTYTAGFDVTASGVTLDCRSAHIVDPTGKGRLGIAVTAPTDVAITDVTVRNCVVEGFMNNVRVTRRGFKELQQGSEYENAFGDIVVENSALRGSRGSGVFVDGYVTGVTLRHLDIGDSGGVGIYLEAGSKDNVVVGNHVHGNGFAQTGPEGVPFVIGGVELRYHHTGREGIAIDGSRFNRVTRNLIEGNSAGGIFLYKNCGEDSTTQPRGWWERRYGADGNLIEGNLIRDEQSGVWIGSRQAENQFPMDCSDPAYVDEPINRVHLDYAEDNVVRRNLFEDVRYGVRVEDDGSSIVFNRFVASDPSYVALIVGTKLRTEVLGEPVAGTTVSFNRARIDGNEDPYTWIHDHEGTLFSHNRANGRSAELVEGVQPPINPFIFALDFWLP